MQRIYWTVDLLEAHVVAGLLCDEGVPAWVFDADMIRQDWFRALAIGGYRVMVGIADRARAAAIVAGYSARRVPSYSDGEMPPCPACARCDVVDDPLPRRLVFATLIASDVLAAPLFVWAHSSSRTALVWLAAYLGFGIALTFPGAIGFIVKQRYVCLGCRMRFRDGGGLPFAALSRSAIAAEASQSP